MITVYKQKSQKTKYYISIVLFLCLLLIIGPICYFNGFTYLISAVTNKFFAVKINLAPLLAYIGVGLLIMYYYYFLFINRSKFPIALSLLIVLGAFLLGSIICYCINGVYLIDNIKGFLFREYCDSHFLLGFILLLIGIVVFVVELISFVKGKQSIAMLLSDKTLVKFKKRYAILYILLTMLFLYLVYSLFLMVFIGQKVNVESVFVTLILLVNVLDYFFTINCFKKRVSNVLLVSMVFINILMVIVFMALEMGNPSFLIQYIKPICPLDYAISFPVLPLLITCNMIATCTISCLSVLSFKDKNK